MDMEENSTIQAEEQADVPAQSSDVGTDYEQFKVLIDSHFQTIKNLLKFNKEKDANVSKLSVTLQKYREGFDINLLKAVALHVISYREDAKKAYREFKGKELPLDTAKKYLGYIIMDYEDLLSNLGIECVDGEWRYNNKKINAEVSSKITFSEPEPVEVADATAFNVTSFDELIAYTKAVEAQIIAVLKNNAERDKLLNAYIEYSSLYESGVQQAVLYPVIRKIVSVYEHAQTMVAEKTDGLTENNCGESYISALEEIIDATETVLGVCSVAIDSHVSDIYDPKKQRILKMVATDDESKNSMVINRYTDCYLMDDKVIYPQKIDVYKK